MWRKAVSKICEKRAARCGSPLFQGTGKKGKNIRKRIAFCLAVLLAMCTGLGLGEAQLPALNRYRDVLRWVQESQPEELDLGSTRFQPQELLTLRDAMPAGGVLRFEATFCRAAYSPDTRELDLNGARTQISEKELRALLDLLPELETVKVGSHRELSNRVMPGIVADYPEIRFSWLIQLPCSHSLVSTFTAYSTMNHLDAKRFTEKSLDVFQYAPEMRALDLGHNDIVELSFLKHMPGLELLILADNEIRDLTPLGELHELRYLEIFMNRFSDLSPLSGCPELLDLNIVRTEVTSLDGLEGCTKLERLWAPQRKQLDEASIERFVASHPDCELAFGTGDATGQGWREHWRYRHYIDCFKTHEWIPFEENENAL